MNQLLTYTDLGLIQIHGGKTLYIFDDGTFGVERN